VALTPPARIWMATSTAIAMKATKATEKLSALTSTNVTTILALISQTARIVLVHSSVFANRDSLAMVLVLKAVLVSFQKCPLHCLTTEQMSTSAS
jgi:hypothetical protein